MPILKPILAPGQTWANANPEILDTVEVQSEATVKSADEAKLGWKCYEVIGAEIKTLNAEGKMEDIPSSRDLIPGETVYVPSLFGGYVEMTVIGENRAEDGGNVAPLFKCSDDRAVWVNDTMINKRVLNRLEVSK